MLDALRLLWCKTFWTYFHNGCVRCCCFCRCCCCSCYWCCSCCYCFPCSNSSCSPLLLVLLVLLLLLLTVLKCPVPGRVISGPAGTRSARRRRTRSIPLKVFSLHLEERFHTHGYGVFWRLKSFPLRLVQQCGNLSQKNIQSPVCATDPGLALRRSRSKASPKKKKNKNGKHQNQARLSIFPGDTRSDDTTKRQCTEHTPRETEKHQRFSRTRGRPQKTCVSTPKNRKPLPKTPLPRTPPSQRGRKCRSFLPLCRPNCRVFFLLLGSSR